jgi:hypothetical protein
MKNWLVVLVLASSLLAGCNLLPQPLDNPATTLEPQATGWSFIGSNPLDVNTNGDANNPSLALDSSGKPVVSWSEDDGTSWTGYVKRWTGSSWALLGAGFPGGLGSLALDSANNPVVAGGTFVKRWNGTSWVQLGSAFASGFVVDMALDSLGRPVVSLIECVSTNQLGNCTNYNVYVKRWTGSSWVQLGGILDVNSNQSAYTPSLALNSSGNPTVSWSECVSTNEYGFCTDYNVYVKRWTGSSWVQLGTFLDATTYGGAYTPSLALDSSGNPTVSWVEYVGSTSFNIYVKRYGTNAWRNLGSALDVNLNATAYSSSIARKSDDKPVVAWQEQYIGGPSNFDTNVYVKEWTGSAWNLLGQVNHQGKSGSSPSLALQTDNKPVVAYLERYSADLTSEESFVYVRRWDGSAFQDVGGALNSPTSIGGLSLALDSSNTPVVAFATCPASCSLYVEKWNGTNWVGMDGSATPAPVYSGFVTSLALALDSTGKPSVVWSGGIFGGVTVKRWNGTGWVQLGTNVTPAISVGGLSIAVASNGNPVVSYPDYNYQTDTHTLHIKRWSGTTWVNYGSGAALNPAGTSASLPSLKLRSNNQPVVAYGERNASGHFDVYVKRWTGTAWLTVADSLNNSLSENAALPSLVLKSNGNPIVSWIETQNSKYNLYVKEY